MRTEYISCLLSRDEGATAVEYAVMLSLLLVAIFTAIASVGGTSMAWWQHSTQTIIDASQAASGS